MKVLDFIKENQTYKFVYCKPNLLVEYPINGLSVFVNGKEIKIKRPFANITKFQHFCVETDLFNL